MEFFSGFSFAEIRLVVQWGWQDLVNTDFYEMKFSETELALKIGFVLVFLILLKIVLILIGRWLSWEKYSRKDSGHLIAGKRERHLLARFILSIPTLALAIPLLAVLFAIASPYFAVTKEEKKYLETRTRIDLRDVSASMASLFKQTKKSKAEIAANAHLKFLEMRRNKNDRTAFWIFSDDPYPVQEDLIVDYELYYLKVYDAPWEIGSMKNNSWTDEQWNNYTIPKSRYLTVNGQGGTQLSKTLKAVIQVFDADAKKQKMSPYSITGRAVLIITDAAISDFSQIKDDFEELNKRRVRPYIIFIDDTNGENHDNQLENISALLEEVVARGGKFFPVSDTGSLDRAYREIDKLEKIRFEIVKKSFKILAFQKFIFLAIMALIIIIPVGLLAKLFYYP